MTKSIYKSVLFVLYYFKKYYALDVNKSLVLSMIFKDLKKNSINRIIQLPYKIFNPLIMIILSNNIYRMYLNSCVRVNYVYNFKIIRLDYIKCIARNYNYVIIDNIAYSNINKCILKYLIRYGIYVHVVNVSTYKDINLIYKKLSMINFVYLSNKNDNMISLIIGYINNSYKTLYYNIIYVIICLLGISTKISSSCSIIRIFLKLTHSRNVNLYDKNK